MYWKSIQQGILTGVVKLLKRHGVDVSQFEAVTNSIINNGILVSGGNFTAAQAVAGTAANASMNKDNSQQMDPLQKAKAVVTSVMATSNA
jgi:hypothetical protein